MSDVEVLSDLLGARLPTARKVVLVVDLVESVHWMQLHESGVVTAWTQFVRCVRSKLPEWPGSRIVKSLGDGLMLEFDAAAVAARAAMEVQDALATAASAAGLPLRLRAGLHGCEVYRGEDDIYGSGVNLTARLAALAEPGKTVCSVDVRDQLVSLADFQFTDLGECYLKHVPDPVRAFVLERSTAEAAHTAFAESQPGQEQDAALSEVRTVLAIVPLSPAPGAVTRAPENYVLADALADDIYGRIARRRDLRVLSRWSCAKFRDAHDTSPGTLRARLGAQYAIMVRVLAQVGAHYRVSVELLDLRAGDTVWADRFLVDVEALFRGEDACAEAACAALVRVLEAREAKRSRALPFPNLDAYTLYAGAVTLIHRLSPSDFDRAGALLAHLSDRVPRSAAAHAMRAKWHALRMAQQWCDDREREGRAALDAARRAVQLDPEDAFSHAIHGLAQSMRNRDLDGSEHSYRQAVELDPNEAYAWALLAGVHSYREQPQEAVAAANRALELSPLDPSRFLFEAYAALALLSAGRPREAAEAARRSLRLNAIHGPSLRLLIIALVLSGDEEAARDVAERHRVLLPTFAVSGYRLNHPGRDAAHVAVHCAALIRAGLS
jgi:adenylate cyclase